MDAAGAGRTCYDVDISSDLISRITDSAMDELTEWQSRPPRLLGDLIHALMMKGI
jgi:transposase-like protein